MCINNHMECSPRKRNMPRSFNATRTPKQCRHNQLIGDEKSCDFVPHIGFDRFLFHIKCVSSFLSLSPTLCDARGICIWNTNLIRYSIHTHTWGTCSMEISRSFFQWCLFYCCCCCFDPNIDSQHTHSTFQRPCYFHRAKSKKVKGRKRAEE